jgi:hypothetical protein
LEPVIHLKAFLPELDRVIAAVETARTPGSAREAAALPERWRVHTEHQEISVSTEWSRNAIAEAERKPDGWVAVRTGIVRKLSGVRDQASAQTATDPAVLRARARATVDDVLARSEFKGSGATRWREQLRARFEEFFEELWLRLVGPGGGRTAAVALAWGGAIAALIGLGFWLARLLAERPFGAPLNLGDGVIQRPRARELALRAIAAARAGDPREAVRLAYNAALVRLEEQGAWKVDDARTPREYLPMLQTGDTRREPMLDLTRRFEQIWYGNRAVSADDAPRVTAHLEALGCLRPGERVT